MVLYTLIKNQTRCKILGVENLLQEFAHLLNISNSYQVSILFCGDTTMRSLNFQFRSKNKTTDVLSFPAKISSVLGDIAISIAQAKKQAQQGLKYEIEMLLCHGFLHLLGYDHEINQAEYDKMMNLQNFLLKNKTMELSFL